MNTAEASVSKSWGIRDSILTTWRIIPPRHRLYLGIASVLMAITSAGNIAVATVLGTLVDRLTEMSDSSSSKNFWSTVGFTLLFLMALYLAREIIHVARRTLVEYSCTMLNRDTQHRLLSHVMHLPLQLLASEQTGSLQSRIFRSADGLIRFVRLMFLDCIPACFTCVFAIATATVKQPILGLIMTGVIPASIWLTWKQLSSQKGVRLQLMRDCEAIDGIVNEQFGGVEYVRVVNMHCKEMERLHQAMESRRQREIRHHFQMSLFGCGKALNEGLFHIIVLAYAAFLAYSGRISAGDVLTISVLFLNVMGPLNEVHRIIDEGDESSLRIADFQLLLSSPRDESFESLGTAPEWNNPPLIRLANVEAAYAVAEGSGRIVLNRLNIEIERGESIGIAGHSGSGKSSWIKVLLRLLSFQSGEVSLVGQPLQSYNRADLSQLVSYVGQNPFVFSGTLRENIAYGCGEVSDEKIREVTRLAQLEKDIEHSLGGFDGLVRERGQNLSGGQKQKIAIARALLADRPILVLDEATSALDNISERDIQKALYDLKDKHTMIMIAHRLSTLRNCDRILVFEDGQIRETGSYEELLCMNGLFTELVRSSGAVDDSQLQPTSI